MSATVVRFPAAVATGLYKQLTLREIVQQLRFWRDRAALRRELVRMPDYLLADIGVDREDVIREAAKRFWQD
ncbi:MAG TPA: DUF1127 domain-containing protein [Alphaproteobacteria bacterium]|nr:DUF1127 domain-containing protein [Alphaproteobacteria bacterium]